MWRGVGGDSRQADEDKTALTTLGEWWAQLLLPDPRKSYGRLQRWLAVLAGLHQHAADSENTCSMLQLGHMLHYGYIQFAPPGKPTAAVRVAYLGLDAVCLCIYMPVIDRSLLCIYMPAIDRSLSACRYQVCALAAVGHVDVSSSHIRRGLH